MKKGTLLALIGATATISVIHLIGLFVDTVVSAIVHL